MSEAKMHSPAGTESLVLVERMGDVAEWEIYRLSDADRNVAVCSVALHADDVEDVVEYALWPGDGEDIVDTGTVDCARWTSSWSDDAREDALRQIVYRYEEDLSVDQAQLVFELCGNSSQKNGDDDADRDDDGDDDDEG